MKRFLAMVLLIIVLVVAVIVPFIIWGEPRFAFFSKQETGIRDFLLASLELVGLLISIAIVVFILYQYIRYRRPYRLIFDAFSNESTLVKDGDRPLNLSILAKEELIHQFKIIFNEIKIYSDNENQVAEPQYADVLYYEEGLAKISIEIFVSVDQIKRSGMIEGLKEVIRTLTDPEDINLMNLVGEIAPKEVTPVMKFIEAIFPPHVIRATGHLQCKSDIPGRVGITFEFVDLGKQRNLLVRTLWQSSDNMEDADSVVKQPVAKSNKANHTETNKATYYYINLLRPTMHWLALMFLEQKLISHVRFLNRIPLINRILSAREKRRQARILYLLGALYYARSYQFKEHKFFFLQLAVEHFCEALKIDSNWCLPYLYLANLYSFKMIETQEEIKIEISEKLLSEALRLYEEAHRHAKELKRPDERISYEQRITVDKALAELRSGDEQLWEKAKQEIQDSITRQDPALYDPSRADCSAYLYNLARWYELSLELMAGVTNADIEARRYLAYSLARSQSIWDRRDLNQHFNLLYKDGDLDVLIEELDKKRKEERELEKKLDKKLDEELKLAKMTGDKFKSEIEKILKRVDQILERPDK